MLRKIIATALAVASSWGTASAAPPTATHCRAVAAEDIEAAPGVTIHVRTIGKGWPILFIPSLARGAADFDEMAARLAQQGYLSILPDPRGTGKTTAPAPSSLADLAHDANAVVEHLCDGPVDVVGHAFGNRVARTLAASSPAMVRSVALLAGGGRAKAQPQVGDSIGRSAAQGSLPDEERLQALQTAFFAKGHDPRVWLTGWYPQAKAFQGQAMKGSNIDQWWTAGSAPVLFVQADEDPVATAGNAEQLKRDIGERVTVVTLHRASHAILPEQPDSVAWLLARYFGGERNQQALQKGSDARVRR